MRAVAAFPWRPGRLFPSLLLAAALLVPGAASKGQLLRTFGVKAGVAAATQDWDYGGAGSLPEWGVRWGINAGAFVEFLNHPWFTLQAEARYVQKGLSEEFVVTSAEGPEGLGKMTLSPRVDYLVFPLMAKGRLELGGVAPYIIAGPSLNVLLGYSGAEFETVLKDFKRVEFGGTAGLGCEIALQGSVRMLAEVRYSPSFTDAYESDTPSPVTLRVRNSAAEFLLGVAF
jgi:hypothetical protein